MLVIPVRETPIAVADASHLEPKVRFDWGLQQLSELSAGVIFRRAVGGLESKDALILHLVSSATAAFETRLNTYEFVPLATAISSNPILWPADNLQSAHASLSEDYDVADTEEHSLQATQHYGW
jgi:hypothetical protein